MEKQDQPTSHCHQLHQLYYSRCPVPSPLSLAVQLGWIDDAIQQLADINIRMVFEGVNPTDLPIKTSARLPNVFRQGGCAPAIWSQSLHQNTRVIGLTFTDEYQALIAMPNAGIHTIKDLRGRRLGLPRHQIDMDHARAAALRCLHLLLEAEGLSLKDVEIIDLPDHAIPTLVQDGEVVSTGTGRRGRYSYSSEIDALSRQQVDVIYVKDMRGAQAAHLLGAHTITSIDRHPDPAVRRAGTIPRPLTVSAWLVENHSDLVDCLMEQVYTAGEWAIDHPSETLALLSREMGWAENWIRYAYGDQIHRHLRLDLTDTGVAQLTDYKNFLLEHQFIQQDVAMDQWLDAGPLNRLQKKLEHNNRYKKALLSRAIWDRSCANGLH